MRIRGLGVITDATVELDRGLTVVTGETGAGKTMVVTGLTLLLGARVDAGIVRTGAEQAIVEGRALIDPSGPLADTVRQAGGELDDDALLLARTVSAAGRSRAHLGGRSVPVAILAEHTAQLIAVHGQSDQLRLLQPAEQRQSLDRFADHEQLIARQATAFQLWQAAQKELDEVRDHGRERAQEADGLRLALAEIEAIDPQPGEDLDLRDEDTRLAHADALRAGAQLALAALQSDLESATASGPGDVTALLADARQALEGVRVHDSVLAGFADRLTEIGYLIGDVAGELAAYLIGLESDPGRLTIVQQRRAELSSLTRKYGATADEVRRWAVQAASRLAELDHDDERIVELTAECEQRRTHLQQTAGELSAARSAAGLRLADLVTAELAQLAMPKARLTVSVTQRPQADGLAVTWPDGTDLGSVAVGRNGIDDIEFRLAPHPGAPPRPVAKGASGGELSRVMLALEVVLAGSAPVPTFVFDEVDAGVGGQAAVQIGRRLAALAGRAQVVVVTHLPQVAAYADRHLVVSKADDGQVTTSGVTTLDDDQRVLELARMLAGHSDSASAQAHARELRQAAVAETTNLRAGECGA